MDFKSALIRCSEVLIKIYKDDAERDSGALTPEQKEAIEIISKVAFAPVDLTGIDNVMKQL